MNKDTRQSDLKKKVSLYIGHEKDCPVSQKINAVVCLFTQFQKIPKFVTVAHILATERNTDYTRDAIMLANLQSEMFATEEWKEDVCFPIYVLYCVSEKLIHCNYWRIYPLAFSIFRTIAAKFFNQFIKEQHRQSQLINNAMCINDIITTMNKCVWSGFVFNPAQLTQMQLRLKGMTIYEIGGASGYCANLLAECGFQVKSCDIMVQSSHINHFQKIVKVEKCDGLSFISKYRNDIANGKSALMILCPMPGSNYDTEILNLYEAFGGKYAVTGGGKDWCGSTSFWNHLEINYELVCDIDGTHLHPLVTGIPKEFDGYYLTNNLKIWRLK